MLGQTFKAEEIIETLSSFEQGVNNGLSPLLVPRNQLHNAINTTVRGTFVHPRPTYKKIALAADAEKMIADAFVLGTYQGGGYFRPDNASGSLVGWIAGHAFQFVPAADSATVFDRTPSPPNPPDQPQVWCFQAEKWLIWKIESGLHRRGEHDPEQLRIAGPLQYYYRDKRIYHRCYRNVQHY